MVTAYIVVDEYDKGATRIPRVVSEFDSREQADQGLRGTKIKGSVMDFATKEELNSYIETNTVRKPSKSAEQQKIEYEKEKERQRQERQPLTVNNQQVDTSKLSGEQATQIKNLEKSNLPESQKKSLREQILNPSTFKKATIQDEGYRDSLGRRAFTQNVAGNMPGSNFALYYNTEENPEVVEELKQLPIRRNNPRGAASRAMTYADQVRTYEPEEPERPQSTIRAATEQEKKSLDKGLARQSNPITGFVGGFTDSFFGREGFEKNLDRTANPSVSLGATLAFPAMVYTGESRLLGAGLQGARRGYQAFKTLPFIPKVAVGLGAIKANTIAFNEAVGFDGIKRSDFGQINAVATKEEQKAISDQSFAREAGYFLTGALSDQKDVYYKSLREQAQLRGLDPNTAEAVGRRRRRYELGRDVPNLIISEGTGELIGRTGQRLLYLNPFKAPTQNIVKQSFWKNLPLSFKAAAGEGVTSELGTQVRGDSRPFFGGYTQDVKDIFTSPLSESNSRAGSFSKATVYSLPFGAVSNFINVGQLSPNKVVKGVEKSSNVKKTASTLRFIGNILDPGEIPGDKATDLLEFGQRRAGANLPDIRYVRNNNIAGDYTTVFTQEREQAAPKKRKSFSNMFSFNSNNNINPANVEITKDLPNGIRNNQEILGTQKNPIDNKNQFNINQNPIGFSPSNPNVDIQEELNFTNTNNNSFINSMQMNQQNALWRIPPPAPLTLPLSGGQAGASNRKRKVYYNELAFGAEILKSQVFSFQPRKANYIIKKSRKAKKAKKQKTNENPYGINPMFGI